MLKAICEDIRNAIDREGGVGCFVRSVRKFSKQTGIPEHGLWALVNGIIDGGNPGKLMLRLHQSWGGKTSDWIKWYKIVRQRPDC